MQSRGSQTHKTSPAVTHPVWNSSVRNWITSWLSGLGELTEKGRGDLAGDKCSIVIGMVIDTGLYTVLKTLEMSVFLKDLLMLTIFKVFIEFVTVLLLFLMFSFF